MSKIEWMARTKTEKARARRLVASDKAKIVGRIHETYIRAGRIVNYEAWCIEEQNEG